jgi:hypothetical protein
MTLAIENSGSGPDFTAFVGALIFALLRRWAQSVIAGEDN